MWTVEPLVLSVEERDELERRVRGLTTAHRDRQRAEVVLLAADGWPGTQIAPRVGMSQQSVCKWRQQFRYGGLDGLADAPLGATVGVQADGSVGVDGQGHRGTPRS